jgi:AcrR family transcriptional regulator
MPRLLLCPSEGGTAGGGGERLYTLLAPFQCHPQTHALPLPRPPPPLPPPPQVLRCMEAFLRPGVLSLLQPTNGLPSPLAPFAGTFLSARLAAHLDHVAYCDCRCAVATAGSEKQLVALVVALVKTQWAVMKAFEARFTAYAATSTRSWGMPVLTRTGVLALLYWAFARLQAQSLAGEAWGTER